MIPELLPSDLKMDENALLGDYYVQLILLQYAIRSVDSEIFGKKSLLKNYPDTFSRSTHQDWEEHITALESVSRLLRVWSNALNNECPNP